MKLQCHRPTLSAAFQVVSGVIPARSPKEILKNVKLHVADGKAVLMSTDQEIGIRYELPGVEIESEGEVLLPSTRVMSILRELTEDGVVFHREGDAVTIRSGQSEFHLSVDDPVEFPPVPAFEETRYYAVPANVLREGIRRTVFATEVESSRYALGGVLVQFEEDSVSLVATDSRRLALFKAESRSEGSGEPENAMPVIPAKAMSLLEKTLGDDEGEVWIAVHQNDALVKCANYTISCRLVEGRFPNYRDVIPKETKTTVDLVVSPFHSAVRQAQIVTNEDSRGVDFGFSSGLLSLTSKATDVGDSKVELPISYEGDDLTITFDPRFVAEFLRVLDPEKQVHLDLTDGDRAAVFRTGDAYTYVIMPLSRDR